MELGYALSSEEHGPRAIVQNARAAEEAGFSFALISDHFHPWVDAQGESPFVWSVIGGIAEATETLRLGTGVTCPTIRIHPAIIAHAAATSAAMMPGRFFLGLGAGENLNEHVVAEGWPAPDERLAMLAEAIEVIRLLWEGGYQTHRGDFFEVEQARLYTLPDEPPPIAVAAAKPRAAELAGEAGDALIGVAPDKQLIDKYEQAGGKGARYGQVTVCWAEDEAEAKKTAREVWPNAALGGDLSYELPLPLHYEQATENVTEDDVAESVICGPDPEPHLEAIREFEQAGYDHVYVHQVGRDQEGFFRYYEQAILPKV
jgi:G6PDH family F420-dependent oxidoreductase